METQNSNIAASNEGATTETYTEKTTAYNDNELSDFSGHVTVMSCALVEALTKTRGLIARSEDFVNILKGESAESSDTYSNISSTGDVASYYDNFCSQEGFTGAIKDNTENITDLGIKEEENLTGIEDELKHLKTISVDISGYATHIRDCITKQNYTSPLYDSLKAYCIDVAVTHDYVKSIRDTYFPVLDGPREHNRSYNYDGAPTDDKENIYTSRIKELGFSERDIEVLKRYTGLTAEQLYNQLSHMPGAEIANMLNLARAAVSDEDLMSYYDYLTEDQIAMADKLQAAYGDKDNLDLYGETVCHKNDWVDWAVAQKGFEEVGKNGTPFGVFTGTDKQAWCAAFVSWCLYMSGDTTLPITAGTVNMKNAAVNKGIYRGYDSVKNPDCNASEYIPEPGDIFFYYTPNDDGVIDYEHGHVGFVASVERDADGNVTSIKTIEGNSGDAVSSREFTLDQFKSKCDGVIEMDREEKTSCSNNFDVTVGKQSEKTR